MSDRKSHGTKVIVYDASNTVLRSCKYFKHHPVYADYGVSFTAFVVYDTLFNITVNYEPQKLWQSLNKAVKLLPVNKANPR